MVDARALAEEIAAAYQQRQLIAPPTSRDGGFDIAAAYAVGQELMHLRLAKGHRTVGRKVGFANKAMWRVLKLDTLVWSYMYDDTVRHAATNDHELTTVGMMTPKVEPEIVFRLKAPLAGATGPVDVLSRVESIALGFEIIDCVYPDWQFTPADFVAAYGLHTGLIVGAPLQVTELNLEALAEQLAAFTVALRKNGEVVAEGSGKNALKNPALSVAELGMAIEKRGGPPLAAGEYISSGTLTEAQFVRPGDTVTAILDGIALPSLTLTVT
ncbi:MAG TPA: fumarylacetoacetate hydrolase family protein [Vicinamibacterales bacterium]|nr:fumarylacetoacetate hydrolase family protein [Vicinamibacterales bacterium]